MADLYSVISPSINETQVLSLISTILTILVAVIAMLMIGVFFYRRIAYKYIATIRKKVGSNIIKYDDDVKLTKIIDSYYMQFRKSKVFSPVIGDEFLHLTMKPLLGIIPNTKLGFDAFLDGQFIHPLKMGNPDYELHHHPLDQYNYLVARVKANIEKHSRMNKLQTLLPLIGLGIVAVLFIIAIIYSDMRVQKMVQFGSSNVDKIIGAAKGVTTQTIQ